MINRKKIMSPTISTQTFKHQTDFPEILILIDNDVDNKQKALNR